MYRHLRNILLVFFAVTFSCDENPILVDCRDCIIEEPLYATLLIKLDPGNERRFTSAAIVRIYEGRLEDNILVGTYYVPGSSWETDVTLNKKYTITATYTDNRGITFVAVDAAFPRLKYERSQCEEPCWFIYDRVANLVIKYSP